MVELIDDARACYLKLNHMIELGEEGHRNHKLYSLMRSLQRRYGGVFPIEMRLLWNSVRLPEQVSDSNDSVESLRNWFEDEFNFGRETSNAVGDAERSSDRGASIDWNEFENRAAALEEGMGSGEEPDLEDFANGGSTEGD